MKLQSKILAVAILPIFLMLSGCGSQVDMAGMNKTFEKYVSYWNTGKFDDIENVLSSDYEILQSPDYESQKGITAFKMMISNIRLTYPDFKLAINEIVYDRDKIAALWTITGTNTGPGDIPATGRTLKGRGISIIHFQDGKIKDEWLSNNNLMWLIQLGYTIKPPVPPEQKK